MRPKESWKQGGKSSRQRAVGPHRAPPSAFPPSLGPWRKCGQAPSCGDIPDSGPVVWEERSFHRPEEGGPRTALAVPVLTPNVDRRMPNGGMPTIWPLGGRAHPNIAQFLLAKANQHLLKVPKVLRVPQCACK